MKTYINPAKESWNEILQRPTQTKANLEKVVAEVFSKIQAEGDKALLEFTAKFDGCYLSSIKVSKAEIEEAIALVTENLKSSIEKAARNIRKFHENQLVVEAPVKISNGIDC